MSIGVSFSYLNSECDNIFHNILVQRTFLQVVLQRLGEVAPVLQLQSIDNDGAARLAGETSVILIPLSHYIVVC